MAPACPRRGPVSYTHLDVYKRQLLDRVQEAFLKHGGAQCGICTPGMILAAKALLAEHPQPTMAEVREGLAGNLCRCTGYTKIFDSVLAAVAKTEAKPEAEGQP